MKKKSNWWQENKIMLKWFDLKFTVGPYMIYFCCLWCKIVLTVDFHVTEKEGHYDWHVYICVFRKRGCLDWPLSQRGFYGCFLNPFPFISNSFQLFSIAKLSASVKYRVLQIWTWCHDMFLNRTARVEITGWCQVSTS